MNRHKLSLLVLILAWSGFYLAHGFCQSKNQAEGGVTIQSLSAFLADLTLKVRPSVVQTVYEELRKPAGVLVAALVADLPGAEEGLALADLIISLNSKDVSNVEALRALLGNLQTGSPVVLQIQREDQLRFIVLDLP
jgi:S1-C subfamily serine protease